MEYTPLHIVPFILFNTSMMFNAIMDTLTHHFSVSVFSKKDRSFWYPTESGDLARRIYFDVYLNRKKDKKIRFIDYPVDAWHLCKSAMIIMWLLTAYSFAVIYGRDMNVWHLLFLGVNGNLTFKIFYDYILRTDK